MMPPTSGPSIVAYSPYSGLTPTSAPLAMPAGTLATARLRPAIASRPGDSGCSRRRARATASRSSSSPGCATSSGSERRFHPLVGGMVSSTRLMVITTTAAASLTAGQSLTGVPADRRSGALFLMVILAGGFQIVFGALGLARLTRFVSYSVTTGFLLGISMLLIASQIPTIAGYAANGSNRIVQAADVVTHLTDINVVAAAMGALTLVLAILLPRARLPSAGWLVAVAVPSALVTALGLDVQIVSDLGEITGGIPTPSVPPIGNVLNVSRGRGRSPL